MSTSAPSLLRLGVLATSRKADEKRLPIHPAHLERIDDDLRAAIMLEHGYGERFGIPDAQLAPLVDIVTSGRRTATAARSSLAGARPGVALR